MHQRSDAGIAHESASRCGRRASGRLRRGRGRLHFRSCSGGCRRALDSFLGRVGALRRREERSRRTIFCDGRLLCLRIGLRDKQCGCGDQCGDNNEREGTQRRFGFFHAVVRASSTLFDGQVTIIRVLHKDSSPFAVLAALPAALSKTLP